MTLPSYVVDGPAGAPTLLLGGSLGSTVEMWRPQVAPLSRRLRVVRFDHRGHGRSPLPPGPYTVEDLGRDVLDLLDHLGVARAHYAGLSMGGMVGMWLAVHAPERVDRLALLCTGACMPPAQGWYDRAAAVRSGGMAAVADAVVARWFTDPFDGAAAYRRMLLDIPAEGYAACCEAVGAFDLRGEIGAIRAPTLVIAGELDPAAPPAMGEQIAQAVPGATLVVVPGAAHLANVERSDVVTDLLASHFAQPAGEASGTTERD